MLRRPLVARASGLHTFLVHQRRHVHHADLTCTCASYRVQAAQTPAKHTSMAYGGRLVRSQVALYPHPFRTTCAAAGSNGAGNGASKLIICCYLALHPLRDEPASMSHSQRNLHPLQDRKEDTWMPVVGAGMPPMPNGNGAAQEVEGYQLPPQEIVDIIDAPLQPLLSFSPDRSQVCEVFARGTARILHALGTAPINGSRSIERRLAASQILQMDRPPPHPPITELGRPELKLAGEQGTSVLLPESARITC